MPSQIDDLICPDCHTALQCNVKDGQGSLACPAGHGPWPVESGIVRFIGGEVPNDGRWVTTYREPSGWGCWGWLRRRNVHWGIPRLLRPMVARLGRYPLEIVDLGCGGGWEFLTKFGHVTGIDHGAQQLPAAASVYNRVIRSSAERLPIADSSADVIVSIWLLEHFPERQFVATLREIRRVLRPGGHLVFFADLDSSKPILRWAKRFPEDYVRYHIDEVGHHGLRSLRLTKFLLQREGFVENETIAVNKSSLLQPVTALWMFNNKLGRRSRIVRLYTLGCRLVLKSRFLYGLLYLGLIEYHRLVDRWLPDTYAFSAAFDWIVQETRGRTHVALTIPVKEAGRPSGTEVDPYCGLPMAEKHRGRRPVAVMIDNSARSHPQRGLAGASVVVEAPVEGGLTRLMPIFTRSFTDRVGPVRSARLYFIDWAGAYQPFFVHCGGSPEARSHLEYPERVIDLECRYHRSAEGKVEVAQNAAVFVTEAWQTSHPRIFVFPEGIFARLSELTLNLPARLQEPVTTDSNFLAHYRPELSSAFRDKAAYDNERVGRVRVEVHLGPGAPYPERFEWDRLARGFRRTVLNTPVGEDATRDPDLLIANLILIWVRVTRVQGDVEGRLRIDTRGEGPAQIWCGPRPEEAAWYKSGGGPIQFCDYFGHPVFLRRGLTWICALTGEAIVQVK